MTKSLLAVAIILTVSIAAGALLVASQAAPRPASPAQLTVAASIFPLADIVRNVAGDQVRVIQLIPAGASPHTFALNPIQRSQVQDAAAIFAIGHNLDDAVVNAASNSGEIPITVVDRNIELLPFDSTGQTHAEPNGEDEEHQHGAANPHYWLAAPNGIIIAKTVADTLAELDPENADSYQQNLARYREQLEQLEDNLQNAAAALSRRSIVTMHDAWPYFTAQYGLNLVATYEPVEGRQPSINDLRALIDTIEDNNITTFYTEPQKQSTGASQFLERELGLTIAVLDPIGTSETESYIQLLSNNMETIARHQGQN